MAQRVHQKRRTERRIWLATLSSGADLRTQSITLPAHRQTPVTSATYETLIENVSRTDEHPIARFRKVAA